LRLFAPAVSLVITTASLSSAADYSSTSKPLWDG